MVDSRDRPLCDRLANGAPSVYADLDREFRRRLCTLIKQQLDLRYQARLAPEDVYQSVLRTFFVRNQRGEFHFQHDGALWKLLQRIAQRKVLKAAEHHGAGKRHPDLEACAVDDRLAEPELPQPQAQLLAYALGRVLDEQKRPFETTVFHLLIHGYTIEEIVRIVLAELRPEYARILQLRLEGNTERQIAAAMDCGREAVRYKLRRIVERMARLFAERTEP